MKETVSDKLDFSRSCFLFLWSVTLFFTLLLCFSSLFIHRTVPVSSLELVTVLDLTSLSLVPSGRILRDPAVQHPGVDMRMIPELPPVDMDSASLFLSVD